MRLNAVEVRENRLDLRTVEVEVRHTGMSHHDALGKGLLQPRNWIALGQRAQGRLVRIAALTIGADCVTADALKLHNVAPAFNHRRSIGARISQETVIVRTMRSRRRSCCACRD